MTRTSSIVVGTLIIAGNASVALAQAPTTPPADPLTAKVDAIFANANRPGTPGCVCAVVRDSKMLYSKGHGLADLERNVPITTDSVFYMASTSKQFTAVSIALLVLGGKLSLSADIRTLIPEMKDLGTPVTVEQLVHHTSGVRDYYAMLPLTGWRDPDRLDNERIMKLLARQRSLNFTPGTQFLYSNSNYVLLAEIVRRVSGKPLPQFAKEHLFDPLGMVNTQFESDAGTIVPNRVLSYGRSNVPPSGAYTQYHKTTEVSGAGNLLSTVADLARWDENFYTGQVGGAPLLELLKTRGKLASGAPTAYGFGLGFGDYRGQPIVEHAGSYQGYRTQLLRFPQQHFSVMALCNLEVINADGITRRVADLYLEKELSPLPDVTTPSGPARVEIAIDPALLDGLVGKFALDANPQFVLTVTREGNNLITQGTGQPPVQVFPSSPNEFFLKVANAQITFHRDADGTASRLTLHQNGDRGATRVQDFTSPAADLQQYLGRFHSEELDVTLEIVANGNSLEGRLREGPIPFRQTGRETFSAAGMNLSFRRNAQGRIEALSFGGGRAANMIFVKQR